MADVVNSISASPQGRTNSYVTSPCSSNNTLVSPKIVEAIDRIFPKSPSQLLPHSYSESVNGKRSPPTCVNVSSHQPNMISTMPCTTSMAYLTTDTTTTATAVFTGLTTSSGTKSPLMSSTPASHMDLPSALAQTTISQTPHQKHSAADTNVKNSGVQKEVISGKRISKADLEIMNTLSFDPSMKNGRAGRSTLSERESSDSQSRDLSDSDDMCRPFIALKKEKKKKRRKHSKSSEERRDKSSKEILQDLDTPNTSRHVTTLGQSSAYGLHKDGLVNSATNVNEAVSNNLDDSNSAMDLSLEKNKLPVSEGFSNSILAVPPFGNQISGDENIRPKKRFNRQKLPKSRRQNYHVVRNSRHIKKIFLPCFIVLRKIDHLVLGGQKLSAFNLSLQERVKVLSSLCAKNKIECASKEKAINDILNYKNVLDDSQCNDSEDEFQTPRGRSLRKRRQDICYAEPSEDDLLEDLAVSSRKKNSGQSKKNSPLAKDVVDEEDSCLTNDNRSPRDISTKKKAKVQSLSTAISSSSVGERESVIVSEVLAGKDKKSSSKPPSGSSGISCLLNSDAPKSTSISQSPSKASGPNLVYVFPKTTVSNTATQASSTCDQSPPLSGAAKEKSSMKTSLIRGSKPGPASKTNRPMNVSPIAPVTTLSMPISTKSTNVQPIPLGFSGSPLPSPSLHQNLPIQLTNTSLSSLNQRNNNMPSNICMVKIDGKDYLLSMPPSNNILAQPSSSLNSTITATAPASQPSLIPAAGPRYMLYQPNSSTVPSVRPSVISQGSVTTRGLTQTLPIPSLTTAITLPGRASSAAIHLLPTSMSQSSILTTPVPGSSRLSSSITSVAISSPQSLFPSSSSLTRPATSVPRTVASVPLASASGLSSSLQTTSTVALTTSGTRSIRSYIAPVITPGSTVIPRNPGLTTASSSTVQLVAPNTSVAGARCFRIIVPACSATGPTARIATLGTSALSSPLTRLSASSALLPQRKHSLDKDMSPEKRAAKRRRLEKKYPLPPGVVIKTEPLDTPQSSTVVQSGSVRSLLSGQNIQLIAAASRSGVGAVQRFRIISPNTSGVVVGSRPVRVGSNVIIRAPIISPPSSRVLLPSSSATTTLTSFSTLSASPATALSSSTTLTSVSASMSTSASATALTIRQSSAAITTTTTTASVSTSGSSISRGNISLLSPATLLLSSSSVTTSAIPTSNIDTSAVSSSTTDVTASSNTAATDNSGCVTAPSQSDNQTTGVSEPVVDAETLQQQIEKLQTLISKQETMGLKGARLDKLKDVLNLKRNLLLDLQLSQELDTSQSNEDQVRTGNNGATADDPLIID